MRDSRPRLIYILLRYVQIILSAILISLGLAKCFRQTDYKVEIRAYGDYDEDLACIDMSVTVK